MKIIMYALLALSFLRIFNAAHARDADIRFFENRYSDRSLSYTVEKTSGSSCMIGVYTPDIAHVSYGHDADLGMHYRSVFLTKCGTHQSYQKLILTEDQNPAIKAYFAWIKPYMGDAYLKIYSDPKKLICHQRQGNYNVYDVVTLEVTIGTANQCGY